MRLAAAAMCGGAAVLLGAGVLAGWLVGSVSLVQFRPGWVAMVASAAIGLVLAGSALVLSSLPAQWAGRAAYACGAALCLLSAAGLAANGLDANLGIDWPRLHAWMADANPRAGRMTPVTGAGLLLLGLALLADGTSRRMIGVRQGLAAAASALALASVAAHVIRLEIVYGWRDAAYMPPHTAAGVFVVGLGLWLSARQDLHREYGRSEGRGILTTVAASLAATTIVAGVMGLAFLQHRVEQMTTETLARLQGDHARLFTKIILQYTLHAAAIAKSSLAVTEMSTLAKVPSDRAARARLIDMARGHLLGGFSRMAFYRNGKLLAETGPAAPRPELEIALRGPFERELLWREGFALRLRVPIGDRARGLGQLVAERPIEVLTLLAADANQWGSTGEMMLCELQGDPFRCVPGRFVAKPFAVPRSIDDQPSIVAYALSTKPGVVSARDSRGERVLAAYGPVGNYGLGMVVKMDWFELYAPMRRQLQIMMASLAAIVALSLWLVHGRVRPLLRQLVESRQRAQANEARFLAAAENSPDAFFILESVRDARERIVDFRVAYLNGNAAKLFSSLPKERFIGQSLCELVPMIRSGGFFDKYEHVVANGEPLLEEFAITLPGAKPAWLSQQVVRLGDGVAVTSRDISERKAMEERFRYLAQNDALTGLPNRALFLDRLEQLMARARRNSRPLALMFLDIDHFKTINDTLGHAAGDALLRAFADCLRHSVRRSDTVARLGGDEFTIILDDLHGPADAEGVAQKIASALRHPVRLGDRDVSITSSIGISYHAFERNSDLTPGAMLEQADQALYDVKRRGRNGYALYQPGMAAKPGT